MKKNQFLFISALCLVLLTNACSKDIVIQKTISDISVVANVDVITWTTSADLNAQINTAFTFNYQNIDLNKINIRTVINQDISLVTAIIEFKEEFQSLFEDSYISNNSASINLVQETGEIDVNDEDALSFSVRAELNQSIESHLGSFNLSQVGYIQIPITFHIINNDNGNGGLSLNKIEPAINRLNMAFQAAKIQFIQCGSVNIINNSDFFEHIYDDEGFAEDVPNTLNVYIPKIIEKENGGSLNGYAFFPYEDIDRIYVRIGQFDKTTLEHEIGHYLSLYHTHSSAGDDGVSQTGCLYEGDGICDTPFDPFSSEPFLKNFVDSHCAYFGDSQYQPLTDNIMSYSRTICRQNFTNDQLERMAFSARFHRVNLICPTTSTSSDLVVEDIWLDDDGNGQYDINTRIKNIGDNATPNNEDININYYVNNQLIGQDTENSLESNESGTEALNNYQFSNSGTYSIKVEITPVSNEGNTNNNSLSQSFQIQVDGGGTSDLIVEDIWLDNDGNGQYDINTKIKNIGDEATPDNENIIIKYYIDNQLVGEDTENSLEPNEIGTEFLSNYQFSNSGTYSVKVEITPVSNEGNTNNNSLSQSFQIQVGGGNTITPGNNCSSAPTMQVETEYVVTIDTGDYSFGAPIEGESEGSSNVRGFWLTIQVPNNWSGAHKVKIYDVSNNFNPVIGMKAACNSVFLGEISSTPIVTYINNQGSGGNETFETNMPNGGDNLYHIRIYHFNGNETPNISFKIKVE